MKCLSVLVANALLFLHFTLPIGVDSTGDSVLENEHFSLSGSLSSTFVCPDNYHRLRYSRRIRTKRHKESDIKNDEKHTKGHRGRYSRGKKDDADSDREKNYTTKHRGNHPRKFGKKDDTSADGEKRYIADHHRGKYSRQYGKKNHADSDGDEKLGKRQRGKFSRGYGEKDDADSDRDKKYMKKHRGKRTRSYGKNVILDFHDNDYPNGGEKIDRGRYPRNGKKDNEQSSDEEKDENDYKERSKGNYDREYSSRDGKKEDNDSSQSQDEGYKIKHRGKKNRYKSEEMDENSEDYRGKKKKKSARDHHKRPKQDKKKCNTIGEIVRHSGDFTILIEALEATGLSEVIFDPSAKLTVFGPTDAAFNKLGANAIDALLTDTETLASILLFHVIGCEVFSEDLYRFKKDRVTVSTMWEDNTFDLIFPPREGGIFVESGGNDPVHLPEVISLDKEACNGVIHVVDGVILP